MRRPLTLFALLMPVCLLAGACGPSDSGSNSDPGRQNEATASVKIAAVDDALLATTDAALLDFIGAANDLRATLGEERWATFVEGYRNFVAQISTGTSDENPTAGPPRAPRQTDTGTAPEGFTKQLSDSASQFVESYKTGENSSSSQDFKTDQPFSAAGDDNKKDRFALTGNVSFEALNGRASVSVEISATITLSTTSGTPVVFTFRIGGEIAVTLCPDADGNVIADGRLAVEGAVKGYAFGEVKAAPISVTLEATIRTTGTVGNDARLTTIDWSNELSGTAKYDGAEAASLSFADSGTVTLGDRGSLAGSTNASTGTQTDSVIIGTFFPQVRAKVQEIQDGIASKVAAFMADDAQDKWRHGYCVEVRASEDSRSVDEGEEVGFTATVWSNAEGRDLDKPLTASFSGDASLDPSGGEQEPPVVYTYTAGDTKGATGTIVLRSVSNRGIGELTLTFTVGKQARGWQVIAVLPDNPATAQTVCDLTKPFTLQASLGPIAVTPTSETAGTMSWSYSKDLLEVSGTATYSFTWDAEGKGSGTFPTTVQIIGLGEDGTQDIATTLNDPGEIYVTPLDKPFTEPVTACP
ncbi:MAG: hypothetical protein RL219_2175 [Actinomycetota bacterium]